MHKSAAENLLRSGDLKGAISHVEYAENACGDELCREEVLLWMVDLGRGQNNDVFRAKGYEKLALWHLDAYLNGRPGELFKAKSVAQGYLDWADSLRTARGDLFPLPDAMILTASIHLFQRPDSAIYLIADVFQMGIDFKDEPVPTQLRMAIGRGKALIDELGIKMHSSLDKGKGLINSEKPQEGLDDLVYAYRAAAAFGEPIVASESAVLLAEYFAKTGEAEIASKWASAALRWKGDQENRESIPKE